MRGVGRPLLIVGDVLLDRDIDGRAARLSPDAPVPVLSEPAERVRPGGAGLAALLAAQDRRDVVLVTALAADTGAQSVREALDAQVTVVALPLDGSTPEKVRIRGSGQTLVRLDRGGGKLAADAELPPGLSEAMARSVDGAGAVLVSDYAGGITGHLAVRRLLARAAKSVPVVWDPHPRGAPPVPGARLVTPNAEEAGGFLRALPDSKPLTAPGSPASASDLGVIARGAARLVRAWRVSAVAVTMGARGALLSYGDGIPLMVPTEPVRTGDPCGAGDRFAVTATGCLLDGALPSEATTAAVAAAREFVLHGGASSVGSRPPRPGRRRHATDVVSAVRRAGGTVVATGGCFDLLHAGHVSVLRLARELGDCLVVCLNSDASVRRIKGPDRPLVPQEDRARVLEALACVDAVIVFDEDDPGAVLTELRPDIWAKGGDYTDTELPEAELIAGWGGQVVLLPYLEGRSTTRLVRSVAGKAENARETR
jgi:D-beta-D-heptose 7-phosphate kinase / D-beta-D-heptose 1-phosphate adenosyltransferase